MVRGAHSNGGGGDHANASAGHNGASPRPAMGWGPDAAWGGGGSGWQHGGGGYDGGEDASGGRNNGAGPMLVHETHAPKRISHIQFGLLNAEVGEMSRAATEGYEL